MAGTNPVEAQSALRLSMEQTSQGAMLVWNTEPGCIYQVQETADTREWTNLGGERFAAGETDSILADGSRGVVMYRVIRIR